MLYVAERCMVFNLARGTVQKTGLKLDNHECFLWNFVFAADAQAHSHREPEARVVLRMAQDNDSTEIELLALFKADAHKCRPIPLR